MARARRSCRRSTGRLRFHARVAVNVLAIVERELALGPAQATAHAERLQAAGGHGRGRPGGPDPRRPAATRRLDEVKAAVWATVRDKLAVANPRYLQEP